MKLAKALGLARRAMVAFLVLVAMTLLVLWLSGFFQEKVPATRAPGSVLPRLPDGVATLEVQPVLVVVREEAVGSVRAVQEVQLASRLLARVVNVHVSAAGQRVAKGDLLVELDQVDLKARLQSSEAALRSAEQTLQQRQRDLDRTRELYGQQISSSSDLERDQTAWQNSLQEVERLRSSAAAAAAELEWATLRAPIDGVVIDKLVEAGDTVSPGEVLMRLYDPERMQLVASVREQLASKLTVGQEVLVSIDALGQVCSGTVAEIVPQATEGARTFEVKVTGPCPPGVFSGMFGRLFVDLGTNEELRIPTAAVRRVGQLDLLHVVTEEGLLARRFVVLREEEPGADARVTVLSGLRAGEQIVADDARLRALVRR
jgi:membrane fusion protein (multidrug efflux system)